MTVLHSGTTKKYSDNWSKAFGAGPSGSKGATKSSGKAAAKATAVKATAAKATAGKKKGAKKSGKK